VCRAQSREAPNLSIDSGPTRALSSLPMLYAMPPEGQVVCSFPEWSHRGGAPDAVLSLVDTSGGPNATASSLDGGDVQQRGGFPLPVVESWTALLGNDQVFPATGGGDMMLTVVGFAFLGRGNYTCRFTAIGSAWNGEESMILVVNRTHGLCPVPRWNGASGEVGVDVVDEDGGAAAMRWTPPPSWNVSSSYQGRTVRFSAVVSGLPSSAPASGASPIEVQGAGFHDSSDGYEYLCALERGEEGMISSGVRSSSANITCDTLAWGSLFR